MRLLPTHDNLFCAFTFSARSRACAKSLELKPRLEEYGPQATFGCVFIHFFFWRRWRKFRRRDWFRRGSSRNFRNRKSTRDRQKIRDWFERYQFLFWQVRKSRFKEKKGKKLGLQRLFFLSQLLSQVWNNLSLSLFLKLAFTTAYALSFLLYCSEIWSTYHRLNAFHFRCLHVFEFRLLVARSGTQPLCDKTHGRHWHYASGDSGTRA